MSAETIVAPEELVVPPSPSVSRPRISVKEYVDRNDKFYGYRQMQSLTD